MTQARVTALLPSYNHARYVEATLRSLLHQPGVEMEVIVLDDGSTDGSRPLLRALCGSLGVRYVEKNNSGLAATLNYGLQLATGDYVTVCASDDAWLPEKSLAQVQFLEANPDCVAVAGNIQPIDADGAPYAPATTHAQTRYGFEEILCSRAFIPAPTVMVRRQALLDVGGYDEATRVEDWPTWLKLTEHGAKIGVVETLCARYRHHAGNQHRAKLRIIDAGFRTLERYRGHPAHDAAARELSRRAFVELAASDRTASSKYARAFLAHADGLAPLRDWQVWMGLALWSTPRPLAPKLEQLFSTTISATSGLRAALRRGRT